MSRFVLAMALCIGLFGASAASNARAQTTYLSGYAGGRPTEAELDPRSYFEAAAEAGLFEALEGGPIEVAQAEALLSASDVTLEDLARTHLLRREGQMLAIDFAYFSLDDMERIHAVVASYAPSLAAAYDAHRSEFAQIFNQYPNAGVSRGDLAFVTLAGVSLNWDALKITLERDWRAPIMVSAGLARYSFWASAEPADYSYHGFYWGSSSFPSGPYNFPENPADFTFSSFGDPYSEPRMNFPDLLYLPRAALREDIAAAADQVGLTAETLAGAHIEDALGFSFARPAAAILFALHRGPKDVDALGAELGSSDQERLPEILTLLETAHYVRAQGDGVYELTAPVFDQQDQAMLDAALALSGSIMSEWLSENYLPMQNAIGPLTMERHGHAYAAAFTQIWHELFGRATRELVQTGLVADPYADGQASPGSISLLWRTSLYDFTPG